MMVRIKGGAREQRAVFLSALEAGLSVSGAAASCGVSRATVYRWRDRSQRFTDQWHDAVQDGTDTLEDEALRRATMGTVRPVFWKGAQVGEVRQYNDRLLMFLLQARRPEVYRLPPGAPAPELPAPRAKQQSLDAMMDEMSALLDRLKALDAEAAATAPRIADAPASPVSADPPVQPRPVPEGRPLISAARTAQRNEVPKAEAVDEGGSDALSPNAVGGGGRRPEGEPTWSTSQRLRGLPSAPSGHLPSKAGEENLPLAERDSCGGAATARGDVKAGLGHTLARLCRAGIEAVRASVLPMPTCDHPPRVSQLSQGAHRMPVLRAFRASEPCLIGRRNETRQGLLADFWRRTCLALGLRPSLALMPYACALPQAATAFMSARRVA